MRLVSSGNHIAANRRIVSLWFPRLATDRLQRRWNKAASSEPEKEAPPLVTVTKVKSALVISGLDRKASGVGLEVGQPLANARAMLPEVKAMAANESGDHALLNRIADWSERFTPFVALDPPRALLLDVTGCTHLFGGERKLLDRILAALRKQDFAVRGALAGTAMCARACSRYRDGLVVPQGEEDKAIAKLPIDALYLDAVTTHAFRRAGLKTIGQVADRGRAELTARFGAAMVFTLEHALGKAERPITPRAPLPDYSAERNFAEPVATEAVIHDTLISLAQTLCEALESRSEGARRLEAAFFRADGAVNRIAIETGSPTRDAGIVGRLFREKLDALADPLDPGFGFDLIRLAASHTQRCEAQAADFSADLNEEREIRFLVDRLAARFGPHRILAFHPNDTHIPEAAGLALPAQEMRGEKTTWHKIRQPHRAPRRPLRMFAKPEPASYLKEVSHPSSLRLRWRQTTQPVIHMEGPERIAMEWWRHVAPEPTRDYFRVETRDGRRFWSYCNGVFDRDLKLVQLPHWLIHGTFA
ncbi:MAG: DNA polymerase Y family protein [Rhizomicrobium sp.]